MLLHRLSGACANVRTGTISMSKMVYALFIISFPFCIRRIRQNQRIYHYKYMLSFMNCKGKSTLCYLLLFLEVPMDNNDTTCTGNQGRVSTHLCFCGAGNCGCIWRYTSAKGGARGKRHPLAARVLPSRRAGSPDPAATLGRMTSRSYVIRVD